VRQTARMLPRDRPPSAPGEILLADFLEPEGMSPVDLAQKLRVSPETVEELIAGQRGLTADLAAGLAEVFGTSAQFWVNLQANRQRWLEAHPDRREP
jgi:antitoxin HigA-1